MADQPRMQMQPTKIKMKPPIMAPSAKESVAALRAELQIELQNKKQCAYQPYECTQLTLDGYNYCLRHILEDKNAPFKQCAYVYNHNSKKCYLPAPKGDKKEHSYCHEHALKTTLQRIRQGSRIPPPRSTEVLLHSLTHYIKRPRSRTTSSSTQYSDEGRSTPDEGGEAKVTRSVDPFSDIDAYNLYNSRCNDVLDMCSESESDVEATTYANTWHDFHADSSDNESIDSEQEDVLKHANVYSAEEITQLTRDKLVRLQTLYIEQYRHLQHLLREKRRKYLHSLKREKETFCSIHHQLCDTPKEQRLYKKLKAYNQYHRRHGVEAILKRRVHENRIKVTEGMMYKPPAHTKCAFTEGGVKCGERALPVARHCRKHILEDPNQVLFRACGKMRADVECPTPVEAIFEDSTCRLHMDIPPIRSYNQIRKDSESDYEEPQSANSSKQFYENSNVKTEIICQSQVFADSLIKNESLTDGENEQKHESDYNINSEEEIKNVTDVSETTLSNIEEIEDNNIDIDMKNDFKEKLPNEELGQKEEPNEELEQKEVTKENSSEIV